MAKVDIIDGKIVEYEKGSKKGFYIDGLLKENLDKLYRMVTQKDFDGIFICDGEERSGKSVMMQQVGYYLSRGNLPIENIVFDSNSFLKRIRKAPKNSCIIFDEAFRGLSKGQRTAATKQIIQALMEVGQRNLFIIVILPSMWELDTYTVLHRSRGVFHVHTHGEGERGYFKFYKRKELIHLFKNPTGNKYQYPRFPAFKGRFTSHYVLDEEEYRAKKREALIGKEETMTDEEKFDLELKEAWTKKKEIALCNLLDYMYEKSGLNKTTIGQISDVDPRTLGRWRDFWVQVGFLASAAVNEEVYRKNGS
jgi:hypothetical protein